MPQKSNSRATRPGSDDVGGAGESGDDLQLGEGRKKYGYSAPREPEGGLPPIVLDLLGRWYWIVLGLILGALGGMYYVSKAPRLYAAQSTVLVKQQAAQVISKGDQPDDIDYKSADALNTVVARAKRPELLRKVAAREDIRTVPGLIPAKVNWFPAWLQLGGDARANSIRGNPVPRPEVLAGYLSSWIGAAVRPNTRLIDFSVAHPVPAVAKAVADGIALEYQAELSDSRIEGRSSSVEILVRESEAARKRLQIAQNALASYERALVTLKEIDLREAKLQELSQRYLSKHPRIIAAKADVQAYREKLLAEVQYARSSGADRDYWETTKGDWAKAGDVTAKLDTARRLVLARAAVLESEIGSQTSVFNSILTKIQESDINSQAQSSEMEVNNLAALPSVLISPKPGEAMMMASFGGLMFGTLIAFAAIRLDNRFHTVAQLERETGLPALAAIPDIQQKALDEAADKSAGKKSGSSSTKKWDPRLVIRKSTSSSIFAEMFRVLRASVSLLGDERKYRLTLFSSALPGEGKTFVSANFALAAAQEGKRTLLIDLDLRKPSVHRVFGLARDSHPKGSTDVLSGKAEFTEAIFPMDGAENLHVMLAGTKAPSPGALLNSPALGEMLDYAAENYDLVVIDSAPLLAVPDTRLIAPLVDNFCLVARAEYVPKGAVRRVLALLEEDDRPPSGIVFNGFVEKRSLIGQNYSYGNYRTGKYGKAYKYGYGTYGAYGSDEKA